MLGEKISFDFELFEVPDRKWGAYDRVCDIRPLSIILCESVNLYSSYNDSKETYNRTNIHTHTQLSTHT